jgi:hypothetical protein
MTASLTREAGRLAAGARYADLPEAALATGGKVNLALRAGRPDRGDRAPFVVLIGVGFVPGITLRVPRLAGLVP